MRQQQRMLKQSALETANAIVGDEKYGRHIDEKALGSLLSTSALIHETDLHLANLALRLSAAALVLNPSIGPVIQETSLRPALALSACAVLQEASQNALLVFFRGLVDSRTKGLDYATLRDELMRPAAEASSSAISRPSLMSISKCIAEFLKARVLTKRQ